MHKRLPARNFAENIGHQLLIASSSIASSSLRAHRCRIRQSLMHQSDASRTVRLLASRTQYNTNHQRRRQNAGSGSFDALMILAIQLDK